MVKKRGTKKKYHKPTKAQETSNPTPDKAKIFPINTMPPDPLLKMLYRFPVSCLLKCRCLSKFWVALIDNPSFIQNHLNFNSSRNQKLISNSFHDQRRRKLVAFLGAQGPPAPVLDIDIHFPDRPNYPRRINFFDFSKKMVLAGSINGIVCLTHSSKELWGQFVGLWNPATRYWKAIALPQTRSWNCVSVGLGFDAVTKDFKIICTVPVGNYKTDDDLGIINAENVEWYSRLEIYSASQDSWDDEERMIPFFPILNLLNCKFIVKGVPYWIGRNAHPPSYKVLGGVDPRTGLFKRVLFPNLVRNETTVEHAMNLRDSVALLIQSPGGLPNNMVHVYVLDDNTADWTWMYKIGPLEFEILRPIQCLSTGEIVLEMWTGSVVPDPNAVDDFFDPATNRGFSNNAMKELEPRWRESYRHVESLVCLRGMVEIAKEHISKKKTGSRINNWSEYLSEELEAELLDGWFRQE